MSCCVGLFGDVVVCFCLFVWREGGLLGVEGGGVGWRGGSWRAEFSPFVVVVLWVLFVVVVVFRFFVLFLSCSFFFGGGGSDYFFNVFYYCLVLNSGRVLSMNIKFCLI